MPYLTPDSLPSGTSCRMVLIPDDLDWLVIVSGALSALCDPLNFEQLGSVTPEEAAERFCEMWVAFRDSECITPVTIPVGATMTWHTATAPTGWLLCIGQSVLKTDYPQLFALWGGKYGSTSTHFTILDMRERSPMGAGSTVALDAAAGAATHTLLEAEMPVHNHAVTDPGHFHTFPRRTTFGAAAPVSAYPGQVATVSDGVVSTNTTGITIGNKGSGTPHNNIPPVRGVNFIVYAGV